MVSKLGIEVVVGDVIVTKKFHKAVNAIHCLEGVEDGLIFEVCFADGTEAEERYYTFEKVEIL